MKAKVKSIAKEIWKKTPDSIKKSAGSAIIVTMAASLLAAPEMDECGKSAVQDMAHDLHYTWDPFDGIVA